MSQTSFWNRLGAAFRGAPVGADEPLSQNSVPVLARNGSVDRDAPSSGGFAGLFNWRARREREAREQEERQARVAEMIGTMSAHFESQDRRAEQLNSAIRHVATTLDRMAEAQHAQARAVETLSKHVETNGQNTAGLLAAAQELPASLQANAEAVRFVAKRFEAAEAGDARMVESLERFGVAIDSLRSSGEAQVETLYRLNAVDERHHDTLKAFIRLQNRRVIVACAITVAIVLFAVGALAVAVAMGLGR